MRVQLHQSKDSWCQTSCRPSADCETWPWSLAKQDDKNKWSAIPQWSLSQTWDETRTGTELWSFAGCAAVPTSCRVMSLSLLRMSRRISIPTLVDRIPIFTPWNSRFNKESTKVVSNKKTNLLTKFEEQVLIMLLRKTYFFWRLNPSSHFCPYLIVPW